jgi:hypothetical protein
MTPADLCALRLTNQRLTGTPFPTPAAAVRHFGALQAQDYAGAKWALSLRTGNPGCPDAELDKLFDAGQLLRTHLMRTTWHFVAPEDIRWMTALLAPRGRQAMSFMNRKEGLTAGDFKRSKRILEKSLRDRQYKTRNQLAEDFRKGGVDPGEGIRLAHLMMDAELEGLVTSGPRQGRQFTYALLDERVDERAPATKPRTRDEALAELTLRYFTGHGPAQAADFAWWSGLTLTEVKRGLEMANSRLESITVEGKTWWWGEEKRMATASGVDAQSGKHEAASGGRSTNTKDTEKKTKDAKSDPIIQLLPNYDEYFIAYKDRGSIGGRIKASRLDPAKETFFLHILFVDGLVAGGWKRDVGKTAAVEVTPVGKLSSAERKGLEAAVKRYGAFLGRDAKLLLK